MPVVILFSVGPGAAVVTTMIYAVPPAIRITALGIRGVTPNTVEAATALGATRRQMLLEGAAAAGAPHAAALGQPDDPVRALDGRDRRADRRPGPRRRRHERPLHEPGPRAARRRRDRDHGDRTRPRRPRRSRIAPTRRSATSTEATSGAARSTTVGAAAGRRPRGRCSAYAFHAGTVYRAGPRRTGCSTTIQTGSTTSRTRPLPLPRHHEPARQLPRAARPPAAAARSSSRRRGS